MAVDAPVRVSGDPVTNCRRRSPTLHTHFLLSRVGSGTFVSTEPVGPLQARRAPAGHGVRARSLWKPTLRLGFLIAPASLQPALRTAKQLTDWHGELPTQAALARFVDDGLLARHIRKVAREYAKRHARICESLARDFAEWLSVIPSAAGLHVAAHLTGGGRSI